MRIISRKITVLTLLIISIIFFSSCHKNVIDNKTFVFKNVNVISMCNDSILKRHSVLINDYKIEDIGIFEEMNIPDDAQIIEGKEKYLIPGLGDMHVHLGDFGDVDDMKLYISNGVTLVRNMTGFPYHLELKEEIGKKRLIGPEIYTTGLILDGLNPNWPRISIVINDQEKVSEILYKMKNYGYDAIKVYEKLTNEVYDEIIRVAKELEMPVVGHVPEAISIRDVLFSGQTSIEHLDGYVKYSSDKQIIEETVKSYIWNCPTLICTKNYENLNYLKEDPPKEIKYVYPSVVERWKTRFQWKNDLYEKRIQVFKTLTNNNANIVAGTDLGNPYLIAGFCLHNELSIMQEVGLTPYQVLLTATKNCAEMLGYESRLGTIEKRKDADLVLLENNPLEDINNTKSITGVMSKGAWYPKEELSEMLDEVEAKRNPITQKSTIHNNMLIKLLLILLILTYLSTFLVRPVLYVFKRNKLKALLNKNGLLTKYLIPFLVISLSILSLVILFLLATLPAAAFQSGLPTTLIGVPPIVRYQILLPFVNLILLIVLIMLYIFGLIRKNFSTYRKWHTLSIISATILLFLLLNYWGLLKLYL